MFVLSLKDQKIVPFARTYLAAVGHHIETNMFFLAFTLGDLSF